MIAREQKEEDQHARVDDAPAAPEQREDRSSTP